MVGTGRSIERKNVPVPTGTNQYRTLHSSGGVEVGGSNPLAPTIISIALSVYYNADRAFLYLHYVLRKPTGSPSFDYNGISQNEPLDSFSLF